MPDLAKKASTNHTAALIEEITAKVDHLAAEITHDPDVPAVERLVDGGVRFKMRHKLTTLSLAVADIERTWTEFLADLERVESEADNYHQELAEGVEVDALAVGVANAG